MGWSHGGTWGKQVLMWAVMDGMSSGVGFDDPCGSHPIQKIL